MSIKMIKEISFLLFIMLIFSLQLKAQEKIFLDGRWEFSIDSLDIGIEERWFTKPFDETVILPGSMTENGKGNDVSIFTRWTGDIIDSSFFKLPIYEKYREPDNFKVPFWLQPEKYYAGRAWYKREVEIPSSWNNKSIELFLERCHWQSDLWIDNVYVGNQNSLGAPHIFNLTDKLSPGKHTITVCVDNRIKEINPGKNSSSLTDHSQTNWNGIIGELSLTARDKIHFGNIKISSGIHAKAISVEMEIFSLFDKTEKVNMTLNAEPENKTLSSKELQREIELNTGNNLITLNFELGNEALLWDEFNPNLYLLNCSLSGKGISDSRKEFFGLREVKVKGTQFIINNSPVFLRGTLECAIFPKTGYPSTDVDEWTRIFNKCKSFGLNHMRFHSWCPPEAAFIAADRTGVYLQVECSSWANQGATIGDGQPIDQYIYDESERIVNEYGNHPSFCFMLYGNEPSGVNHQKYLSGFVTHWKNKDNRHLYAAAAAWPHLEEDDFYSMYEPRIQQWGGGLKSIINSQPPKSDYDWKNIISHRGKPVISHEIGQWCVYPNFNEIKKYDGVLFPRNFEIFKEILSDNGMVQLADSFLIASGKLQVLCYKADIEAALRTKNFGGFQLLDLHDFPGQGTALVGVLDPFWDEKGYVTADEYSQFCNATVPLARFSKFVFNSAEELSADIEIAHFGRENLNDIIPVWKIINETKDVIAEGMFDKINIPIGNGIKLGSIRYPLRRLNSPAMYTFQVEAGEYRNQWDFWVYPSVNPELIFENDIKIVRKLDDETIDFLNNGGKVLLTPVKGTIKNEKGGDIAVGFSSIFWNTAWTLKQPPHTLGILCNPHHPMLNEFPTQFHSNYQWWDAMSHSNAILLNELGNDIQPVVRIIDDWFSARPLGLIIEANVGKGKLVLTGIDLLTDLEKRPEARQLMYSILKYMRSITFKPGQQIDVHRIKELFNEESSSDKERI
jgi:hypothetical protein